MKTRIKKIIIMAVALLFVSVGVSFAHDQKSTKHKPRGHAYGHYKKGYDYHPGWSKRHLKPKYNFRDRYRYREVPKFRYHYNRPTPRGRSIIGFKVNEPDYKIAVVVKNRR